MRARHVSFRSCAKPRDAHGADYPVLIAVTGRKQASDAFDYHVAKPYEPNDLVRLLAKVRPAAR